MHGIIEILLGLSALYCGGSWLWWSGNVLIRPQHFSAEAHNVLAEHTFRLGLCFVLSLGFLGLMG